MSDEVANNPQSLGRDSATGRFTAGHKFSPQAGNPNNKRMFELRRELLASTTPADLKVIWHKLFALASDGDVQSIKIYLEYAIGKPSRLEDDPGHWRADRITTAEFMSLLIELVGDTPEGRVKAADALERLLTRHQERAGAGAECRVDTADEDDAEDDDRPSGAAHGNGNGRG